MLDSRSFYQLALPKLTSEDLELKGIWESHPVIISGRIVSLSESFDLVDIRTYACTNPRCRNNDHVIRHVGFDILEQPDEFASKPEVFITKETPFSNSKSKNIIKCQNCREDINELYPFRSTIEFKIAKLKTKGDSCFSIDLLLVGSAVCSKVKLSNNYSINGFPKLSAELPEQFKVLKCLPRPVYFEVYGIDQEVQVTSTSEFIKQVLDLTVNETCESLRFPLLILICQIIGSANGIHFDVSFPGIDNQIMQKISNLFTLILNTNNSMGSMRSNSINLKIPRQRTTIDIKEEVYPFLVNIVTRNTKPIGEISLVYTEIVEDDQVVHIPIGLSLSEGANIILNQPGDYPKFNLPRGCEIPNLSESCVKGLQEHFLSLRNSKLALPLKFSLNLLTKLAQISAIASCKECAGIADAEFSIMIHSKLIENTAINDDCSFEDCLISPSVSFDSSFTSPYTPTSNYFKVRNDKKERLQ